MPESHAARGTRRARRSLVTLGEDIRAARLSAGLTLDTVARASGVSASEISRVERGLAPWLDIVTAARVTGVVGLDLVVRSYPGGDPVRDIAHLRLLEALQGNLGPGLRLRTEVAIGEGRDQRAWDAVLDDGRARCGVELETRVTDAQSLVRRVHLKARDSGIDRVILIVSDTNANRRAVGAAHPLLHSAFPINAPEGLAALRSGHVPDAGVVLLLRLDRIRRSAVPRQL